MFKILILVCAVGIDRPACTPETADSVVLGPKHVGMLECGLYGQAQLATGALAPIAGKQYIKVRCLPADIAEAAR